MSIRKPKPIDVPQQHTRKSTVTLEAWTTDDDPRDNIVDLCCAPPAGCLGLIVKVEVMMENPQAFFVR